MPTKKPKLKFIIACDDIRQEVGNKFSFMGIYSKDIVVPKLPFIFPKLCFAVRCQNIEPGSNFEAILVDPMGNQLGQKVKGIGPENKNYDMVDLHAFFSPLKVNEEGEYKFASIFANAQYEVSFNIKVASPKKN